MWLVMRGSIGRRQLLPKLRLPRSLHMPPHTTSIGSIRPQPLRLPQPLHLKRRALNQESSGGEGSEEPEGIKEDQAGLFLPEFLRDTPDGDWGLHVRLAQAMQAEEKRLRHCFLCQSPDHLMHDCQTAKNRQRPLKLRGPTKNKLARVEAKAKAKAKTKTPPPPTLLAQPALAK